MARSLNSLTDSATKLQSQGCPRTPRTRKGQGNTSVDVFSFKVDSPMLGEISVLGEPSIADVAHEGLLPSVRPQVIEQVPSFRELSLAALKGALVRTFGPKITPLPTC